MPAKASCEVKTRTVRQPQKNGDIYVIERQTRYDPVKKYNVVLSSRIVGKIPKGETSVVPTRPKRSSGEKVSVSNVLNEDPFPGTLPACDKRSEFSRYHYLAVHAPFAL